MNQRLGKENGFSRSLLYLSTPPPCAPSHPAACLWSVVGAARGTGQGTVYFKWGDMGTVGLLFTWLSHNQIWYICARRCTAAKSTRLKADFVSCEECLHASDWVECNISFSTPALYGCRGLIGWQRENGKCTLGDDDLAVNGCQIQSPCLNSQGVLWSDPG